MLIFSIIDVKAYYIFKNLLCEDGERYGCPIPSIFVLLTAFLIWVMFWLLLGWEQLGSVPSSQHGTMLDGMG